MVEYVLNALPTFALVLVFIVRTETRLTRIETKLDIYFNNAGRSKSKWPGD
jgi:hypothetical protein